MTTSNNILIDNAIKPIPPFLKWPGGKRWLAKRIIKTMANRSFQTYYEPFLGGGALFFALRPQNSVLTDINHDLINTYYHVKHYPTQLISRLKQLPVTKTTYYTLREHIPQDPLECAVRFLFLNRTAFGGIYRLNKSGNFNVPYGGGDRTPKPLWERDLISNASIALATSTLKACDFENTMRTAGHGDLVYCDPTYAVSPKKRGFIRYNETNFSWDDQKRLAKSCRDAAQRGVYVIVTNACNDDILSLFDPHKHTIVQRHDCLCPISSHRRSIEEYLFVYEPQPQLISTSQ